MVGWNGSWWVGHVGVGWVMQGWGGSCSGGGVLSRVGWVM